MILSDNETKVDMLNNRAIATTIVGMVLDEPEVPVSIGVHGDWGAGKSSILEMIIDELDRKEEILCMKFNGWQFQGFEDAKIALIEGIVNAIVDNRSTIAGIKEVSKKVFENIKWLKVGKAVGGLAISAHTGMPTEGVMSNAIGLMNGEFVDPQIKIDTIESFKSFIEDPMGHRSSVTKRVLDFRNSFDELLEISKLKQLVVLVDDLDRCLPRVAVETLEAIRLFMFTKNTAFIVAADESMIEYSVREHFPDLMEDDRGKEFARKYLEKLIQIPFRIPTLGEMESRIYIVLLMVCSSLKDEDDISNLIKLATTKLQKPWQGEIITAVELKKVVGKKKYEEVNPIYVVACQICNVLARGASGNPRQIKRFLNSLLLRYKIAQARGLDDEINLPVLAKLMISERFLTTVYKKIAKLTDENGKCLFIKKCEKQYIINKGEKIDDCDVFDADEIKILSDWEKESNLKSWLMSEPLIGDLDLRPYYFVNKEKVDYFSDVIQPEVIVNIAKRLLGDKMVVVGMKDELNELSLSEAKQVCEALTNSMHKHNEFIDEPAGLEGLKVLVETKNELQNDLLTFLEIIPIKNIGPWIIKGWGSVITNQDEINRLIEIQKEISENGNEITKKMMKTTTKRD